MSLFDFNQLDRIESLLHAVLNGLHIILRKELKMDANIQAAIDQIAQTKSIEQASAQALGLLTTQAADLKTQIAALQAQVQAGTGVSAADLTALNDAVSQLHDSSVALQTATPANTEPAPAPAQPSS